MLAKEYDGRLAAPAAPTGLLRFVPSLYQVTLLAILGAVLIIALAPRLDTDFWWHVKVGAYIASHHLVPAHDFFTFTFVGHSWTDHEWLSELILYGSVSVASLWGPVILFAAVICATFALVYVQVVQRGVNRILSLFTVAAAFICSSASWGPRIQMLSLFLLSLYALLLYRFSLTRDRRLLAAFPLLMLPWANLHGGFVLGLVILGVTLVGEWLNRLSKHPEALPAGDIKALAVALLATAAATIVNPNGLRQILYPLTFVLPNAYTNLIEESASPNFHMPVMMVFEALLLLLIASALVSRARVNWTHVLLIVAFTHLALTQVRNVPLWAVVVAPLVAVYLQNATSVVREQFAAPAYRRRPVSPRAAAILNAVLLLLVAVAYAGEATHFVNAKTLHQAEAQNYPMGAIAYMRDHRLPPHVFVSYAWGGYLLYHLYPRYRDFMDSRADTLFDDRMLNAYLTIYGARPAWKATLAAYHVQDVLVEKGAPVAQALAEDNHWRLAFHDNLSVLYTRG